MNKGLKAFKVTMNKVLMPVIFAALSLCPLQTHAQQNPILPGFHADPEIVYSNLTNRYYIYSTTDGMPGWGGYTYQCFSSADLKECRDEAKCSMPRTDRYLGPTAICGRLPFRRLRRARASIAITYIIVPTPRLVVARR